MANPTFFLEVDASDLEARFGFAASSVTGWWDKALVTLVEQPIYLREGTQLLAQEPTTPPGDLVVAGSIVATDNGDFETKLLALKRFLRPRGTFDHTLVFGNQSSLHVTARYMGMSQGPTPPQMIQGKVPVDLHFHARDPIAIDASDQTVSGSAGTPEPIPLGTERSRGTMSTTLSGSASSVTFTYKHHDGTPLGSMTLTHGFVAADVIAIDNDAMTILVNGSPHPEYLSTGDFIRFDPNHGDPSASQWPTIEVDHGAMTVTYRRRYS